MQFGEDKNEVVHGFYRAKVVNNGFGDGAIAEADAENNKTNKDTGIRGRIQVRVLGLHSFNTTNDLNDGIPDANLPWAEQAGSMFGGGFGPSKGGISLVPEVGAWVWVFFENGNVNKPIYFASVIGDNDRDTDGTSDVTVIKTKSGHKITITDTDGEEKIEILSKGQNKLLLDDTSGTENVTLISSSGSGIIVDEAEPSVSFIDGNNTQSIKQDANGITVTASSSGEVTITTTSGDININPATGKIGISNSVGNLKDFIDNIHTMIDTVSKPGAYTGFAGFPIVPTGAVANTVQIAIDSPLLGQTLK